MTTARSLKWRYYAYQLSHSNGFYLPVSILYLQQVRGFGLGEIGLVLGAFSVAMVLAEVPTGYVGDRLGRRASLAASNVLGAAFMVGYVLVESPLAYVGLHAVWAVSWAFRSGTRDAYLYEVLRAHLDESEFARISGRATSVELAFEAGSAAAAGALATVAWSLPFLANAAVAALGVVVLRTLPPAPGDAADETLGVRQALDVLALQVRRPELRWLVAYAALFHGLFSVTRTFEQPALATVGVSVGALGPLYAGFKLVSAGVASSTGWIRDRIGARGVFAALAPVYGVAFGALAVAPVLVVPLLFLNRSVYRVITPVRNQYLNDRLDDVGRATVLSGASMALSLATGSAKLLGGVAAETTGLLAFLSGAGVAVAGAGGLLWLAVSPVRSRTSAGTTVASVEAD